MNNLYAWKQIVPAKFFAVVTVLSLLFSAFPAHFFVANATVIPPGHDKVDICHWSEDDSEFTALNVPKTSIGTAHGAAGGNDGDIIPAFDLYPGQNLGEDYNGASGSDVLAAGCSVPSIEGSISGTKYDDVGNDGSIDGDSGLSGWTIRLYEVDTPWVLIDSDETDVSGNYEFNNIPEGSYKVCEVMKDDWTQTFVSNGSTNESPNVSEEGPKCRTVNINTDEEANTVNFGNHYEEPTDFCDPSQRPGGMSIAAWHEANDFDGTDCFDYEVILQCGSLDVQFTENETGLGYGFHYVLGDTVPANFEDGTSLPVSFDEDENGGSVEVTYYVVGAESDYFTGSNVPNFWDKNGTTVLVDTDCDEEKPICEIGENLLEDGSFEGEIVTNASLWQKFASIPGWVIEKVSDDSSTTLELMRGWSGNEAADGEQYAELDGDHSTKVSQTVATIEGATYELKWAFAPRHNITAEQNQLSVLVNGGVVASEGPATAPAGLDSEDWTRSSYPFVADSDSTTVTFSDAGPSDSYGTFLDDAALCLVKEPEPCEPEKHVFADNAEDNNQGLTKGGDPVTANRSNPDDATSDPDWTPGGSTGFYSLGFGGWIVVSFDKYVVNVDGDDLSVHEATNGNYPEETAQVEVSQNGSDWFLLSEEAVNNSTEGGTGVTLLDFDETGLDWIKYVRLTDTSDTSLHANNADGFDLDTVDATYVVCDEPEQKTTIVAHKIVCTDEAEMPNYGTGGPNMNADTAQDWVDNHESCSLEAGWEFQWGPKNAPDTDDDFVGEAGSPWNTFGPTDVDGKATAMLLADDIEGNGHLWFREVLQEGYIPFTHQDDNSNSNDVSAEVYCHTDVLNFDNRDRIDGVEAGQTYYCVAWNHQVQDEPEYGPYCGDGIVNQSWEQCDGEFENEDLKILKECFLSDGSGDCEPADLNDDDVVNFLDLALFKSALQFDFSGDGRVDLNDSDDNADLNFMKDCFFTDGSGDCEPADLNDDDVVNFLDLGLFKSALQFDLNGDLVVDLRDDTAQCTDSCLLDNQCSMERLVKITLDDTTEESSSFDGTIHLGSAGNAVPNGTWFNFDEIGDDSFVDTANAVDGLAVERNTVDGKLALAFVGGNARANLDLVQGDIMTLGIDLGSVDRSPNPDFKLENGSGNSFDDVFDKNGQNIDFDLRADTGNDGVTVEIGQGDEHGYCPECLATVEARILLNDSGTAGNGDLSDEIVLGDAGYTTVGFGEWFPVSVAPFLGASAVMIDDPNTVTNFADAGNKAGLFVSREDGTVKVALYGEHQPGGNTNHEWIDARIEIRDAEITNFATLPGQFKFENHNNPGIPSNDGYDEATADDTGVDFKMWVDTASDGFKFDITEIDECEDDTEDEKYLIDGHKYEGEYSDWNDTVSGWSIYLYEGDTDNLLMSTTTDEDGYYYFWVMEGEYRVEEGSLPGWYQVGVNDGGEYEYTEEGPEYCFVELPYEEDEYPVFNSIALILDEVEYNYSDYRCDFYNERDDQQETITIHGTKYEVLSDSDPVPYAGWTVFATNGVISTSTVTKEDGEYWFTDLPPGDWTVTEDVLSGWSQAWVEQNGLQIATGPDSGPVSCLFSTLQEEANLYELPYPSQSLLSEEVALLSFSCDFYNEQDETITTNGGGGSSSGTRTRPEPTPLVLGEAISQCPFLEDFMQIGWENDTLEVTKLQLFLNIFKDMFGGTETPVTGVFDRTTDTNVKAFQEQFRSEILDPWFDRGIVPHNRPTGFVYKTTLWKINDIVCPEYAILPDFEGEDLTQNVDLD